MNTISWLRGVCVIPFLSLLCVALGGCERASVTPSLPEPGGEEMGQVGVDVGRGEEMGGGGLVPDEPVEDELGHGEDKPAGELAEQGPFHGFWSAIITRVEAPPADPRETEARDEVFVGRPFVSFELTQARDAAQGAGSFVMGAGSGAGGVGDSFEEVSYASGALRLRWKVGEGEKPYLLTTRKKVDEDHYEAVISSEFDPAELRYIISLERLPAAVNAIDPDPL